MCTRMWIAGGTFVTLTYVVLAVLVQDTLFSPDSWAYFELAQTVFSSDPYRFTTWRSYFSPTHSASFPLGYPVFYALLLKVSGHYMVSVWGNIVFPPLSLALLYLIARRLEVSLWGALLLGMGLVFFPGYMTEVLSGRSIPLSIALFLCAFWLLMRDKRFLAGLLLGLATLIRFDMLVAAVLLGIGAFARTKRASHSGLLALGFLLAVSPWILYSQTHFGSFWISDNSWVAMSAADAFVRDFPAEVSVHAVEEPLRWMMRVVGNIPKLVYRLGISSCKYTGLWLVMWMIWRQRASIQRPTWTHAVPLLLLMCSLAPYLLTGYINERYFSLFLLGAGMLLLYWSQLTDIKPWPIMICVALMASIGVYQTTRESISRHEQLQDLPHHLAALSSCHDRERDKTYIFTGPAQNEAPRYGAIWHQKAAVLPSNFTQMTESEKAKYFALIGPHHIISNLPTDIPCHAVQTP